MEKATIKSISLRQSKSGDNAITIEVQTEQAKWAREWIGINAPDYIFEVWETATGIEPMKAVTSGAGWSLLGVEVQVEIEETQFGLKIKKVAHIDTPEHKPEPEPEKEEIKADDIPF